jgi:hypothetical protein
LLSVSVDKEADHHLRVELHLSVCCALSTRNLKLGSYDNVWTTATAMEGFFDILLEDVLAFYSIADSIIFSLLVCNVLALALLSISVIRSVSGIFPTCQHRAVATRLLQSLPLAALGRAHRFYASSEGGMAALDNDEASKAHIERMDDVNQNSQTVVAPAEGVGKQGSFSLKHCRAFTSQHHHARGSSEGMGGGSGPDAGADAAEEKRNMHYSESESPGRLASKRRISFRWQVWTSFNPIEQLLPIAAGPPIPPASASGRGIRRRRRTSLLILMDRGEEGQANLSPPQASRALCVLDKRKLDVDIAAEPASLPLTAANLMR